MGKFTPSSYPAPDVLFAMNRAAAENRQQIANPRPSDYEVAGSCDGYEYDAGRYGTSWSCPRLSLRGYGTERQLRNAIKRTLAKRNSK